MGGKKITPTIGIVGCLLCFSGLLLGDYIFAGVISNWWYIINVIYWLCFLILGQKKRGKKRITLFELLLLAFMVLAYYISMPSYSYKTAMSMVRAEQVQVDNTKAEAPWKYRGFTDGKVYLIVFEAEETKAFWFDPYSGKYGPYDIEENLPFLFDDGT